MIRWNLRVPVIFEQWADADLFLDRLHALGGAFVRASRLIVWVTVDLPAGIDPFSLPGVLDADLEETGQLLPIQILNPQLNPSLSWATFRVNADLVHPRTRGEGVHIAYIDTGFTSHPEFSGADIRNITMVDDPEITSPLDTEGHGTMVLGMMASQGINLLGVAPGAAYSSIKVSNTRFISLVLTAEAVALADSLGANIINISLAFSSEHAPLTDAIRSFVGRGGLVIAAVGNNGSPNHPDKTLRYPATLPETISVGATNIDDGWANPLRLNSSFGSAFGPWPDSPDCVAPGDEVNTTNRFGSYSLTSGTSFSAPIVAGCFALSMSANPAMWGL